MERVEGNRFPIISGDLIFHFPKTLHFIARETRKYCVYFVVGFHRVSTRSPMSSNACESSLDAICERFSAFGGGDLILERDDLTGIAKLAISNPTKKNSFSGKMMVKFRHLLTTLESWQKVCSCFFGFVFTSFCSLG